MKKFFILVFAAVLSASCLGSMEHTETYPLVTDFSYSPDVYLREFGADSTCLGSGGGVVWYDLAFHNKVTAAGEFKGGFLLSYLKAPGLNVNSKDYVVNPDRVAGNPFKLDNTYAVYHMSMNPSDMPERDITFLNKQYGTCTVKHCWINNTEEVYEAAKSFETGDKLVLTATGYLNGVMTGEAQINLALPDTTMYNWTKFNLEKLGEVDAIDFELYTSRTDIPTSFCLDELNVYVNITY